MPARIKVTKEQIIQSALDITRKEGIAAVNARRLAKELHCSIQPVYYYFTTMDHLRAEIITAAKQAYNSYIEESKKLSDYTPFKAVGMTYILFASKEPALFQLLFMANQQEKFHLNLAVDDNYEYILQSAMEVTGFQKEKAIKLYEILWITTHGIATMIATHFMNFTKEQISSILTTVMNGIVKELRNDDSN